MSTQRQRVLDHLLSGETLTAREALMRYSTMRLAARIHELRREGYPVLDRRIDVPRADGETATVAQYYLPEDYLDSHQQTLQL